jgi:hypothetical protein
MRARMPFTYKAGVAFATLVEEAELLRYDAEDFDVPTAITLWYRLTDAETAAVARFARVLLWLGESEAHGAFVSDLVVPDCLKGWAHLDLEMGVLRRAFGDQLIDDLRYEVTDSGRAEIALGKVA